MRVQVQREELDVRKQLVDTGAGVRVHKTVHEVPARVDETLWHDELQVERIPVDRLVAPGDAPAARYEGDTLVVPVLEEVLVVEKRCRIKEELRITRQRRERQHVQSVGLRHEEVAVERFGHGSGTGNT